MNLDILAYAKHSPPLECTVQRKWKDILPDLGLRVQDLLQSEINLNSANTKMAGNLRVLYVKIRGGRWDTGEGVESKSMVYMIKGNIVLASKAVLGMLGCFPKHFPRVGEFLEPDDKKC
jgi:hypothetical protein